MTDKEILLTALEHLRRGWSRSVGAVDAQGDRVHWLDKSAVRVCADSALLRAFHSAGEPADNKDPGFPAFVTQKLDPFVRRHFGVRNTLHLADLNESSSEGEVIAMFEAAYCCAE